MKGAETKSEIVKIGAEIIATSGFNATGLDAVLKKAKVPKGSFYYYFSSKEAFGLAVIDRAAEEYAAKLSRFLKDESHPPLTRLRRFLESHLVTGDVQCKRGCLIGNLGQELASQNEKFRRRIDDVFLSWQGQISDCLREAKVADSDKLAAFILMGWEGAILRAKVMKSNQPMKDFIDLLFGKVLG